MGTMPTLLRSGDYKDQGWYYFSNALVIDNRSVTEGRREISFGLRGYFLKVGSRGRNVSKRGPILGQVYRDTGRVHLGETNYIGAGHARPSEGQGPFPVDSKEDRSTPSLDVG